MRIPKERHHSCKKIFQGQGIYRGCSSLDRVYIYIYIIYIYVHVYTHTYIYIHIPQHHVEPHRTQSVLPNPTKPSAPQNCGGTPINLNKPQADIYKPSNLHTLCPIYGHAVTTKHVKYPNVASGALARCSGTKKIALPSSLWSLRDLDTYRVDDG